MFSTFRPQMFQNLYSPVSAAQHPQPCCPAPPTLLCCFSEEATNVGFLPTIQRQHMLCIPLHCRGRTGEHWFSALSGPKCSKTCTPPCPRPSTPNPAAQHPQPCLLLLRRSNECRFPSHHTKTAHDLYSPALPRARGGVQVFSTFRPQIFQNLCSTAEPVGTANRTAHRNRTAQTAIRFKRSQPNLHSSTRTLNCSCRLVFWLQRT